MEVSVRNQSIKFFTIFVLAFNVFAGGDDRDEEYYEALDKELAAFEAQLAEDLANQAALEAFQQKLAEEKAAAAASTEAYQASVAADAAKAAEAARMQEIKENLEAEQSKAEYDAKVAELMEALAIEQEIAAFEAQLEADLASDALDREIAEFEAQLEADLANQAALAAFQQKLADEKAAAARSTAAYQAKLMMAEIIEEERAQKLAEFLAKLEAEKAASAKATAIYQARVQQDQIIKDNQAKRAAKLAAKQAAAEAAAAELAAFKAELSRYAECKAALSLSDSNIALFKTALEAGNLFNVGPQITAGTEFTANRWDDYASCIGALGYKNPF